MRVFRLSLQDPKSSSQRWWSLGVVALSMVAAVVGVGWAPVHPAHARTLWVARYAGKGSQPSTPESIVASPDGSKVYLTGRGDGKRRYGYVTIAYDASGGGVVWTARYQGSGRGENYGSAIAVSPDGSEVFVTGSSSGAGTNLDEVTVAYDADTGHQVWVNRYDGPASSVDTGTALVVSPGGSTVFATGWSTGRGTGPDYTTIAYSASTGARLWVSRHNGAAGSPDFASSIAVSPNGSRVFVTGESVVDSSELGDVATIAYSAVTGKQLWIRRYGTPSTQDRGSSIAVNPGGTEVFVAGLASSQYVTLAYTMRGHRSWVSLYRGPNNGVSSASSIAVSPNGRTLFVTGESRSPSTGWDYATLAYGASSGLRLWARRYNGPGNGTDSARSLVVSPDGAMVLVTGDSNGGRSNFDFATLAYDAVSGRTLWRKRYQPAGEDDGYAVAVSPSGSEVFVTGPSSGDYATVAYLTAPWSPAVPNS